MESYEVAQGAALVVTVTLRDERLQVVTDYAGTEPVRAELWPGGTLAPLAAPAAAWEGSAPELLTVSLTSAQTAALAGGRYFVRLWISDNGADVCPATFAVDIVDSAGTATAPPAYTTFSDLKDHARGWLPMLQRLDDGSGFLREQGRARSWLEDCAHAHFRVASMALVVGGYGSGPRRSGARSPTLTAWLADDALIVTDKLREACAKKALSLICEGVVDGDQAAKYSRLADLYRSQADWLAVTSTLELDTDGDGSTDVVIDLSSTDPL